MTTRELAEGFFSGELCDGTYGDVSSWYIMEDFDVQPKIDALVKLLDRVASE